MTLALDRYTADGYSQIEGWLQAPVLWALKVVARAHEERAILGDICEIGIHHGRFLLAIESVARDDERCIAVDIFDDQEKNVDRSGAGSEAVFRGHVERYAARPQRVEVMKMDSTSFSARRYFAQCGKIRIFSVDGGHTIPHVKNDLRLAEGCLSDGGVIFLDDWFNPAFPSVNEGFAQYLDGEASTTPVVSIGGKLLLSGVSWQLIWKKVFKAALAASEFRAKTVRFHGHDFWHIWK